jgi:DNA-binding transcriptional LysR family regulator
VNPLDSRHIDEIAALLAVASAHSFVAAGRLLQRHPTVISKRLAAMEKRLGVRLMERTTRQVRLTDAGNRLVERLRSATGLIIEAEQEASLGAAQVRGVLRLAFPAAMGRLWLASMLPEFLAFHPLVSVEVDYSDRVVDIIGEGFDAAIRIGELNDNRLVAKKLSDHRRILCASPSYIGQYGLPSSPKELTEHNCLGFTGLAAFPEWRLSKGDRQEKVIGILGAGEWLMSRDIANGQMVRVLPEWDLDAQGGIYLVRASAAFTPATLMAFKEWLEARFAQGPPWQMPVS